MSPRDPSFDFHAPVADSPSAEQTQQQTTVAATNPRVLDYVLLLVAFCFSMILLNTFPMRVTPSSSELGNPMRDFIHALPFALRLTEGIILFWPLFFLPQKMRGREQGLTAGEWLWVISWVGIALLSVLSGWEEWGRSTFPAFLEAHGSKPRFLWYLLVAPSMAALALLLAVGGMMRRTPDPWTHTLSLALMIWPVLPLGAILALGKFA